MLLRDHREKCPDGFRRVSAACMILCNMISDFPAIFYLRNLHMADTGSRPEQHRIDKRTFVTAIPADQIFNGFLCVLNCLEYLVLLFSSSEFR